MKSLVKLLADHPKFALAGLQTPLRPVRKFGGNITLWIKQDDVGSLAGGGNKLRKLEYLVAAAVAEGADTLLTVGAIQSNHARLTAAVAASLGLSCRLLLIDLVPANNAEYRSNGNILLNSLLGADCRILPRDADASTALFQNAEELRQDGKRPYCLPFGGSNWLGCLGYAACGLELFQQCKGTMKPSAIYVACGSGGTQAGLVAALHSAMPDTPVIGINVFDRAELARGRIMTIFENLAERSELEAAKLSYALHLDDTCLGNGYGIPTTNGINAIREIAATTGVILDPVYTGKAMAALLRDIKQEKYPPGSDVIFLHTGGMPALFAYGANYFSEA